MTRRGPGNRPVSFFGYDGGVRVLLALLLVCGCQKIFSVSEVGEPRPIDAPTDVPADGPPIDAPPPGVIGCADGTREWLVDLATYPRIAGCSGTWGVPGLHNPPPASPICPGNGNSNPSTRTDCDVSDLCAAGWHVCVDDADLKSSLLAKPCHEMVGLQDVFFTTRQRSTGASACEMVGANDLFGCGSMGIAPNAMYCSYVERASDDSCFNMPNVWDCGINAVGESDSVVKLAPQGGGALCCKD